MPEPGTPLVLKLTLNGQEVKLPIEQARAALWGIIPPWMKDSTIAPPQPEPGAQIGFDPMILSIARTAMKNMARPFIGPMHKFLYGQELQLGRRDSLPVLIQLLIDFVLVQAAQHDVKIGTNDEGTIQEVRSSKRDI